MLTHSGSDQQSPSAQATAPARRRIPRWLWWVGGALLVVLVAAGVVAEYIARHAEPILRRRVVATLEDRFHSHVELDGLNISVVQGLQVSGRGLRIFNPVSSNQPAESTARQTPVISIRSFSFRTGFAELLAPTMRVNLVRVEGMSLVIPPKPERKPLLPHSAQTNSKGRSIEIGRIVCSDLTLTIETNKPGKMPLIYDIRNLTLHDVGPGKPFPFDAWLLNAKPVGNIHSTGSFGPWQSDDPRETPVSGSFSFTHADLATIKGISGMLSSTGNYGGSLGNIGVTGTTDTPDFALEVSQHPVDLKTQYNATVDGTTGDTVLNSIRATLLDTVFDVKGSVLRAPQPGAGHIIQIDVVSNHARIQDLLTLAAKTTPPEMQGAMSFTGKVNIAPGHETLAQKLRVQGTFTIRNVLFNNPKWQTTIDGLSARAQGNPKQAGGADAARVTSQMSGSFNLAGGMLTLPRLHYQMPGAEVNLVGKYRVDGRELSFDGVVRTQATASHMLTGWKSIVALPFDKLLAKNGAGLVVPIHIGGTTSDPKVNLDMSKLGAEIFARHNPHPSAPKPPPRP